MKITFEEKENTIICTIENKKGKFKGEAKCHPDDMDFFSPKVGQEISQCRAAIGYYRYEKRDKEIWLMSTKHLYSLITQSKNFNPKSYEAKMIKRQIKIYEDTIKDLDILIEETKDHIKSYIKSKELFYQIVRKNRKMDKNK